ncbi:VWA domain-containing protein [Rhodovulum sp. ES.010]|uniref:VWA domain-containing protein n=1 Tax=Rhodovulum sp. ES.010 TaxID=1882821 RepID=UPI000940EEBD|nr:VWA domain-containing protein [Rhodovulum sp. ES.010]
MSASVAAADTIDADLMFVVDTSGSMGAEFTNLGAGMGSFVSQLEADSRIGSVRVGLVRYTRTASLDIDLTDDLTVFDGLTRGSGSGTENALNAVDFAVTSPDISYRDGAVKSVILITDEDADDRNTYSNEFGDGASALSDLLVDRGFLNNIIYEFSDGEIDEFTTAARPTGALFDIDEFRANPEDFLTAFADAKLEEIIEEGGGDAVIPLPASAWLLIAGMGGLAAASRRKKTSA